MIATIILGIFAVLFAFLSKYRSFRYGLGISFFLIFLFLALRFNFGNDYKAYLNLFNKVNQSSTNLFDKSLYGEYGWLILCRLFKPFGFFVMIAVIALLNCYAFYWLIKKYSPPEYYWLAVFLYVFSSGFMLVHSSAMRQSIVISLFVFSFDFLFKKKAILYFLLIGLATFFHKSAIFLLPIYLLSLLNWKTNKAAGVIIVLVFISLFLLPETLIPYGKQLISDYFEQYEGYTEGVASIGSGLGVLYSFILLILVIYFERFQDRETALVFKIAIISFMFIPLSFSFDMVGRIGMYFGPATIVVYPIIMKNLNKSIYRIIFLYLLLFMTTYSFFQFFSSETYKEAFGTYHTILSAP